MLKKLKSIIKKRPKKRKEPQPRASRIAIYPLYDVTFEPAAAPAGITRLHIANLSETGIGLIPDPAMPLPRKGDHAEGYIHFPVARFPISLKVAFASEQTVGCAFEGELTALRDTILKYFAHELAAKDLLEVNSSILKEESEGRPRLFRGRRNCELYLVEDAGRIVRFQMSFFGNYIEGGEGRATKYGFLTVSDTDRLQYKGSALVRLVPELSPEVLAGAGRLLDNIESLTPHHRDLLRTLVRKER